MFEFCGASNPTKFTGVLPAGAEPPRRWAAVSHQTTARPTASPTTRRGSLGSQGVGGNHPRPPGPAPHGHAVSHHPGRVRRVAEAAQQSAAQLRFSPGGRGCAPPPPCARHTPNPLAERVTPPRGSDRWHPARGVQVMVSLHHIAATDYAFVLDRYETTRAATMNTSIIKYCEAHQR